MVPDENSMKDPCATPPSGAWSAWTMSHPTHSAEGEPWHLRRHQFPHTHGVSVETHFILVTLGSIRRLTWLVVVWGTSCGGVLWDPCDLVLDGRSVSRDTDLVNKEVNTQTRWVEIFAQMCAFVSHVSICWGSGRGATTWTSSCSSCLMTIRKLAQSCTWNRQGLWQAQARHTSSSICCFVSRVASINLDETSSFAWVAHLLCLGLCC